MPFFTGDVNELYEGQARVDYDGPDESVECAYPPCSRKLRRSDFPGPQWCSKAHREASLTPEGQKTDA